jgi:aspartyl protease family protein
MNDLDRTPEQSGQRRMGKGMIIGAWLGLLFILTLFFNSYLEQVNNPNPNPETSVNGVVIEVALHQNRSGHYVANGKINGRDVTFLLDTGATDVAVSDELASTLGLRPGAYITSQTANGIITARQTTLSEVSVGGIRLYNVRASILPGMQGDEALLGMSFLKQLELVQRGEQLLLRQYKSR